MDEDLSCVVKTGVKVRLERCNILGEVYRTVEVVTGVQEPWGRGGERREVEIITA